MVGTQPGKPGRRTPSAAWLGVSALALGVATVLLLGYAFRPARRPRAPVAAEGWIPRVPIDQADHDFEQGPLTSVRLRKAARGAIVVQLWPPNADPATELRTRAFQAAFDKAAVPRERIDYHARYFPKYRVDSWTAELDTVYCQTRYRFFIIAVLETAKGYLGTTYYYDGVSGKLDYEEEWEFKDDKLTFVKTFFPNPPRPVREILPRPTRFTPAQDLGAGFAADANGGVWIKSDLPRGPLAPHQQVLGLAVDYARSVMEPNIPFSRFRCPSLAVVTAYAGSPASGCGVAPGDFLLGLITVDVARPDLTRALPATWWTFPAWSVEDPATYPEYLMIYRPSRDEVATPRLLPHRPADEPWVPNPDFTSAREGDRMVIEGKLPGTGERWTWIIPREKLHAVAEAPPIPRG